MGGDQRVWLLREDEPVVGEVYTDWEGRVGRCVQEIVGHVDEVGPRSVDLGCCFDGLLDSEVGVVGFVAERIEDEGVGGAELGEGVVWDLGDIGAVREREQRGAGAMRRVEDEPKDGEFPMHEGDGGDRESKEFEGLIGLNDVGDERGDE